MTVFSSAFRTSVRRATTCAVAACTALGLATIAPLSPAALAQGLSSNQARQPWLGDRPFITNKVHVGGNQWRVDVWSPANRMVVSNNVLVPAGNQPRPSFYLLPGLQGGEGGLSWLNNTDIRTWFADKNVNIVLPLGGAFSLYTDWDNADPILGINKWNTYMGYELPPLIDAEFNGTGRDAIGGLSSTGGAALDIAAHNPARFRAAASYSGCPSRADAAGVVSSTLLIGAGGGSSFNAWGLPGSASWNDHDPAFRPERLRDVKVFVAAGSGRPGAVDRGAYVGSANIAVGPGIVEAFMNACTNHYVGIARAAGVDVNYYYTNEGAHSFGLFEHQLKVSWAQTIARTIGA